MIQISQASPSDLDDLMMLFDAYRVFYHKPSALAEARAFLEARLQEQGSVIYVARNPEGKAMGFTQLYPLFSSTRMQKLWLLNDLFVGASFRKQGVAQALIRQAQELCRESGACGMFLETGQDNVEGNQLYPKMGFNLIENNFYGWDV